MNSIDVEFIWKACLLIHIECEVENFLGGDNDTLRTSAAAHGEPRVVLIK